MKAAGFQWVALTMQAPYDYKLDLWETVIQKATAQGVVYLPWAFLYTDADCVKLRAVVDECAQRQNRTPAGIWDAEKPLDPNQPGGEQLSMEAIVASSKGCEALLSTEPWAFAGVPWWTFPGGIDVQLFPAENEASKDPRSCRSRFYSFGSKDVRFQIGVHGCQPSDFPYRESPYSIYAADDCSQNYAPWSPQALQPLSLTAFPYLGPFYGPSSKKPVSRGPGVMTLKRALHSAGFGDFWNPDGVYNGACERAMKALQRHYKIQATGQYGKATWERMRRMPSVIPGTLYAVS
jgi:hypothetical protein